MTTSTSKRLLTAQKLISYFASLDQTILEPLLAPNLYHEFRPGSLEVPRGLDKTSFLGFCNNFGSIMTGFPFTAKEYTESEASNQVVVWATSKAQFREEVKDYEGMEASDWEFEGEYVLILTMDESGERIERYIEFMDSKAAVEKLLGLMGRAQQNLAKRGGE
ncbi:hypothetical protein BJY00DRAFT_314095 [Aspergillus carlsbadensis]|nr:hypothetical protein BJY00DRAFT_314095 [Aspergillus carlsbadensis]